MWLQESITVPDPLPSVTGKPQDEAGKKRASATPPRRPEESDPASNPQTPVRQIAATKEVELTKISFDPSSLAASAQRPSLRFSSARMPSMAGSSLVSAQEYDDLRFRYTKAKRELVHLSDIQKDLEYSRFELARCQEEMKVIRDSHYKMKGELDEANHRADQDRRIKIELEMKLGDDFANHEKDVQFLRRQIDDLRDENAKRLHELNEQQESEAQMRIEAMRTELAGLGMQMDSLNALLDDVSAAKTVAEDNAKTLAVDLKNAELTIAELEKKLVASATAYGDLERQHREFIEQAESQKENQLRAMKACHDEHVSQVVASKESTIVELREELVLTEDKKRQLDDEVAGLRHKNQQLADEMSNTAQKHEKALRRMADDHQLKMSEQHMAYEAAVREAKGSRSAVDEENQALQRQVLKVTEELSTVASILAQREKQVNILEKDNDQLRETISHKEQQIAQVTQEIEVGVSTASENMDRVKRLMSEKEMMEEEFEHDIKEHKDKNRALESTLMECRKELLQARKDQMTAADETRVTIANLRSQISELTGTCGVLQLTVKQLRNGESDVEEARSMLGRERQTSESLRADLAAALSRCNQLEERLNGRQVRDLTQKSSRSPVPTSQNGPIRNGNPNISVRGGSKRERPEDARVVAISGGMESATLFGSIKQLPNVAVAESKSNMPVPPNLTHLITNGQLTIKLLSALVKGCWVLPEKYISESRKHNEWLPEADYGFQHDVPPLQGKRVFMTPSFIAGKNYKTASVLLKEGNALITDEERDADMVWCSNADESLQSRVAPNGRFLNWEALMETIYPQKIVC